MTDRQGNENGSAFLGTLRDLASMKGPARSVTYEPMVWWVQSRIADTGLVYIQNSKEALGVNHLPPPQQ